MPANIDLASAEIELVAEIRRELILRRILEPPGSWYDFILIDCPPSLGLLTANSLCASQEVLIPLQCEYFAMRGIRLLLSTIDKIKARLNPELRILGILPTMYATGTIHAREVVEEMRAVFGEQIFDIVIQKSIRFPEATVANQAMLDYASKHQGTRAYQPGPAHRRQRTPKPLQTREAVDHRACAARANRGSASTADDLVNQRRCGDWLSLDVNSGNQAFLCRG
ncbi:AAA family ATPase [Candidatus Amarolinea dominans]|uniref:ParA family protein n=1 Tax=Candidatus Amarolinea dominans TaxID=3140696 RepID=UPI0031CC3918